MRVRSNVLIPILLKSTILGRNDRPLLPRWTHQFTTIKLLNMMDRFNIFSNHFILSMIETIWLHNQIHSYLIMKGHLFVNSLNLIHLTKSLEGVYVCVCVCEISLKDLNYDWLTVRKVVKVNSLSYDMVCFSRWKMGWFANNQYFFIDFNRLGSLNEYKQVFVVVVVE